MTFKHFIITRFNIPFIRKENVDFLFEIEYLKKRFEIFRQFCYHSIKGQSCQNFIWLVLFDHRTPNTFKQLNKQWNEEWNNYVPIYIDFTKLSSIPVDNSYVHEACRCAMLMPQKYEAKNMKELHYEDYISRVLIPQYINNIIHSFIDKDTKYVITTRIDNDDCFDKDMIATIQKYATEEIVNKIINFDNGIQYIEGRNICQSFFYPNGHFTSIIESTLNPLKTAIYWEHYFIDLYKEVVHFKEKPLWLEIIHDNNAINTLKLNQNNHLMWDVNLHPFSIDRHWNRYTTFVSLFKSPSSYIWPKFKMLFHLHQLKHIILNLLYNGQ